MKLARRSLCATVLTLCVAGAAAQTPIRLQPSQSEVLFVTRQMGVLDGYAVAIITDRGPVVRQTDGDSAHVAAMNDLAELLARRLAYERRCGLP